MVCPRCISAVKNLLDVGKIPYEHIELGEIKLKIAPEEAQEIYLRKALQQEGFEWIDDPHESIVAAVIGLISAIIQSGETHEIEAIQQKISTSLAMEFSQISKIFLAVKSTSIQHYILLQKIEKVKALLQETDDSLKEIAYRLHFSHPAHLSSQFKNITGQTPSEYKKSSKKNRLSLDSL